jgi:hypothetical protein
MPELAWAPIHGVGMRKDEVWNSWLAHATWDPSAFRSLLVSIANDTHAHIAFLSERTDCLFIPYDGGADGFSFDLTRLRQLSSQFSAWKSSLPSGL